MSLTTRIEQDYIAAYKAKDALRLGVLRLLKTAAKNLQVELMRPVTDEELASVVQKQAKQRQDSIEQFTAANRPDLAEKEAAEKLLPYVTDDLPKALRIYEETRDSAQNSGYDLLPENMKTVTVYIIRTDLQ